jgi:uncharacterized membrane protein YphA (DoxX/SURF4 family)
MNTKDTPSTKLYWVTFLRMLLGLLFLATWWENISKGFYTPDGLLFFFTEVFPQSANPLQWYAGFIENVILPIRGIFGPVQFVGELLMGLFLLFGVFTPLTSLVTIFFTVNTFLATYGHDWPWSYMMILGILIVVFGTKAGRSLGVDAWLHKRRGEPPLTFLW